MAQNDFLKFENSIETKAYLPCFNFNLDAGGVTLGYFICDWVEENCGVFVINDLLP